MKITIPFHPAMARAVLEGRKVCTSRNKRYGKVGDWFLLGGKKFVITGIKKQRLDIVLNFLYKEEGFNSPEEFLKLWNELHPRKGFIETDYVWVHYFREADNDNR